ncbi:MAG: hypothetical protein JSV12_01630 [Candidatus Bathyarchaeota archaeon]|nr:MAG: hypothetical protein JSV12_01630 [Candidatus Bathyarchaeota archaeon]
MGDAVRERVTLDETLKADLLVTSCPFCCINLGDASRQTQLLPVSDLTEIVAEAS